MQAIEEVQQLLDHALIERLTHSVRSDRQWTVRLLVEMGEVHTRGLYRDLGFSSMFEFATRKLGMSEAEAGLRIWAAKLGRSFPIALEMLARSELNLTTLSLLAPVLTHESLDLLHAARFKSKQEVLELIARHAPRPDVPDSVRKLPPSRPTARAPHPASTAVGAHSKGASDSAVSPAHPIEGSSAAIIPTHPIEGSSAAIIPTHPIESSSAAVNPARPIEGSSAAIIPTHPIESSSAAVNPAHPIGGSSAAITSTHPLRGSGIAIIPTRSIVARPSTSSSVQPLSAERYKISFTANRRVRDLLREAQDLRRHRHPTGDLESLFEWALELAVAAEKKRQFAQTEKPRVRPAKTSLRRHSRYIPNAIRRQVWQQHEGRCCFVAADGKRCEARSRLEFHHVVAFARGGPSTDADNIVLLCRAHNALEAERDFGRRFMRKHIEQWMSRKKIEKASIAKQLEAPQADEDGVHCRSSSEDRPPPMAARTGRYAE